MDWRLLLTTFGSVFLAEFGDKTQIATLCFAAGKNTMVPVFIGSSLALVTSTLIATLRQDPDEGRGPRLVHDDVGDPRSDIESIATLVGSAMVKVLPIRWIHLGAGAVFLVIGAVLVIRNLRAA